MGLVMQAGFDCCKEQYCIGTWNVRSMYRGKLEVVKQEMTRMNIYILGINELKWTSPKMVNTKIRLIIFFKDKEGKSPRK